MDREEACGGIREVVMVVEDTNSVFRHTTKHSVASIFQTPPNSAVIPRFRSLKLIIAIRSDISILHSDHFAPAIPPPPCSSDNSS